MLYKVYNFAKYYLVYFFMFMKPFCSKITPFFVNGGNPPANVSDVICNPLANLSHDVREY